VNLASALVLARSHDHGHDSHHDPHGHAHHAHDHQDHHPPHPAKGHGHHDLNLRSAYLHVITDAFTSVLAIAALSAGLWGGWGWLDPAMGIVGAGVILWWGKGLVADSARVLLDREMDAPVVTQLRTAIESDGDAQIADLHVWRVGRASYAAVVTVVADQPLKPEDYRRRVAGIATLAHVSVEVNRCPNGDCP
jgi:cation diffusion facilitator family transporter